LRDLDVDSGKFITIEGGEGAGKSTQARLLRAALEARGIEVLTTREPGGSPGAEAIRRLLLDGEPGVWEPLTEALLHNAARREHVVRTIAPTLAAGHWVVCDRFTDSTLAYQGHGQGVGGDTLAVLQRAVVGALTPDLTLILDIPIDAGQARVEARAKEEGGTTNRYERMDAAFHQRLRAGFLEIAERDAGRCALIDASQDAAAVHAAIRAAVRERLDV
jgi:dTMP kinase